MVQAAEFDQLMAGVVAGSEDAIWQLADTYTPYIIRAVRQSLPYRLRSKIDSQDFAQTLWASLLLKHADFTRLKSPEQLIAYLVCATKNRVIDKTRHYEMLKRDINREERLQDHMTVGGHAKALCSREETPSMTAFLRDRWNHILSNSSERDCQILKLRLAGRTFEFISTTLQIDQATARRAIQRLIKQLSD
jgi:RNA polymerase sigma factor (sigma-70 family)